MPTIHGNMLVGPTAEDLQDKQDYATTAEGLASIEADVRKLIPNSIQGQHHPVLRSAPTAIPRGFMWIPTMT